MAAVFVPAVGKFFAGATGPIGAVALSVALMPLNWAKSGGGPTVFAFWGILAVVMFGFAYWVWHWDIGYKISKSSAPSVPDGYSNTMKREPEEPERSPTTTAPLK
jgi:hypothetical protein